MSSRILLVLRIILGLAFALSGANKLFMFMPMDLSMLPGSAAHFMQALMATGYMFKFIGLVELVGGLGLLLGQYVPFVAVMLFPVSVNILLFHLLLAPSLVPGLVLGLVVFGMNLLILIAKYPKYKPMLKN